MRATYGLEEEVIMEETVEELVDHIDISDYPDRSRTGDRSTVFS